jgi:HlyD family secretion protein
MKSLIDGFRTVRKVVLVVAALLLLAGAGYGLWQWRYGGNGGVAFRTEKATRGQLVATINASGPLVPEEVIDVGAQVAGQITKFGADLDDSQKVIDYCARVEKGTVLARIDPTLYDADVKIARADLLVAQADQLKAEKDLLSAKAKVDQRKQDLESAQATRALAGKNLERDRRTPFLPWIKSI